MLLVYSIVDAIPNVTFHFYRNKVYKLKRSFHKQRNTTHEFNCCVALRVLQTQRNATQKYAIPGYRDEKWFLVSNGSCSCVCFF